jgi:hypothetical protein
MRVAITTLLLAILVLSLWVGRAESAVAVGEVFQLKVGASVDVGEDGLVVGFTEVPSDGRCPIGLLCIWEGDAAAVVWAAQPGTDRAQFTLHTSAMFSREALYASYRITLLHLSPYPVYQKPTDPAAYVMTLVVNKSSLITGTEPATWSRIKALYTE